MNLGAHRHPLARRIPLPFFLVRQTPRAAGRESEIKQREPAIGRRFAPPSARRCRPFFPTGPTGSRGRLRCSRGAGERSRMARACSRIIRECSRTVRHCSRATRTCSRAARTCSRTVREHSRTILHCSRAARTSSRAARRCSRTILYCSRAARTCSRAARTCSPTPWPRQKPRFHPLRGVLRAVWHRVGPADASPFRKLLENAHPPSSRGPAPRGRVPGSRLDLAVWAFPAPVRKTVPRFVNQSM